MTCFGPGTITRHVQPASSTRRRAWRGRAHRDSPVAADACCSRSIAAGGAGLAARPQLLPRKRAVAGSARSRAGGPVFTRGDRTGRGMVRGPRDGARTIGRLTRRQAGRHRANARVVLLRSRQAADGNGPERGTPGYLATDGAAPRLQDQRACASSGHLGTAGPSRSLAHDRGARSGRRPGHAVPSRSAARDYRGRRTPARHVPYTRAGRGAPQSLRHGSSGVLPRGENG